MQAEEPPATKETQHEDNDADPPARAANSNEEHPHASQSSQSGEQCVHCELEVTVEVGFQTHGKKFICNLCNAKCKTLRTEFPCWPPDEFKLLEKDQMLEF